MPHGHHGGGGHRGGHHGHHGGHGRHRGWGGGVGPWWGYPTAPEVFLVDEESDLDRRLKELKILEQMKKLSGQKAVAGFDMPSMSTLLIGAAFIGGAYLLMRKR